MSLTDGTLINSILCCDVKVFDNSYLWFAIYKRRLASPKCALIRPF